jgi:hypothetical protein
MCLLFQSVFLVFLKTGIVGCLHLFHRCVKIEWKRNRRCSTDFATNLETMLEWWGKCCFNPERLYLCVRGQAYVMLAYDADVPRPRGGNIPLPQIWRLKGARAVVSR